MEPAAGSGRTPAPQPGTSRNKKPRSRQKRWSNNSMSSQRLEEIIQQLMKPIGDLRQNFDTNLSSLLEEYLTEAGLHHLDSRADNDGDDDYDDVEIRPDFARIALLLQQSANIYSKKVDFFEQSVLDMIANFDVAAANTSHDDDDENTQEQTHTSGRRKRKNSGSVLDFSPIDLEPAPNIDREVEHVKPPPKLPKTYIEFEPRIMTDKDAKLTDYLGEVIGVVSDFHVNWNLKDGLLVDDLDSSAAMSKEMVCPIDLAILTELRRTPQQSSRPGSDSGIECLPETPEDTHIAVKLNESTLDAETPAEAVVNKQKRTKKENTMDRTIRELPKFGLMGSLNVSLKRLVSIRKEFELSKGIVEPEIKRRKMRLLKFRWKMSCHNDYMEVVQGKPRYKDFVGFTPEEESSTLRRFKELEQRLSIATGEQSVVTETDVKQMSVDDQDDGFHDECDSANATFSPEIYGQAAYSADELAARVDAWHAHIAPRIAAAEKHSDFQVHMYCDRLLTQMPQEKTRPFCELIQGVRQHDVSRYFLATLFMANTGNVDIIKTGPPLSVDSFDVRLLSEDRAHYSSANPFT